MALFAEIDSNNIVIRVLVTDDNDPNGDNGYQWLIDNFGGRWIETSHSGEFRGAFAGTGMIYDKAIDEFIFDNDLMLENQRLLEQESIALIDEEVTS